MGFNHYSTIRKQNQVLERDNKVTQISQAEYTLDEILADLSL